MLQHRSYPFFPKSAKLYVPSLRTQWYKRSKWNTTSEVSQPDIWGRDYIGLGPMLVDKHQYLYFLLQQWTKYGTFFLPPEINQLVCIRSKWEPLWFQSQINEGVLTLDWLQCWWINTMAWFCPINNQRPSLTVWPRFQFGLSLDKAQRWLLKLTLFARGSVVHGSVSKQSFHDINIDTDLLVVLTNKQEYLLNSLSERGIVAYECVLEMCFNDVDTFWKSMWKQVQTLRAQLPVSFCYRWMSFELMIFQVQVSLLSCW